MSFLGQPIGNVKADFASSDDNDIHGCNCGVND
jgi:hypothetical protein